MDFFRLKNTDMSVSRFSLGTWAFSGAKIWGPNAEADSVATINAALEAGINLIDTAAMYGEGKAEEILGKTIKTRRKDLYISTKVRAAMLAYNDVIAECEGSLKRLQTDYVDVFLIHWPNPAIPADETMRALEKLKADGKIRSIAVSNHGPQSLAKVKGHDIVLNQLPYSMIWRQVEYEVVPASLADGVAIWAYCPLAQGLLSGKYKKVEDVPLERRETRFYSSMWKQGRHTDVGFEDVIFPAIAKLQAITDKTGISIAALALAFLKNREGMGSILVGARNVEQLKQNIDAYETKVPADVLAQVMAIADEIKPKMGKNGDLWENVNGGRIK